MHALVVNTSARLSAVEAKQEKDRLAQLGRRQCSTALCQAEEAGTDTSAARDNRTCSLSALI